jgi:nitrite reductase (NADH) large subunit
MMSELYRFKNFLHITPLIPKWLWTILKVISVSISILLVVTLIYQPQQALRTLWTMIIPLLPFVFFAMPGLWRNICPMATLNQVPRHLGISMAKPLPPKLKEYGFVIGIILLFSLVTMRKIFFNSDGISTAILIGVALSLAFISGIFFNGRSGWCGSLCPMLPVQRLYGQTPYVDVRNSHCQECVGCTKNCFDFNPSAAYLADQYDKDEDYRNYRKFFAACFPGFVLAYYFVPEVPIVTVYELVIKTAIFMMVSAGVFYLFDSYLKVSSFKITSIFAIAALNAYYWFNIPNYLVNNFNITGQSLTVLTWLLSFSLFVLSINWLYRTYAREASFLIESGTASTTQVAKTALKVLKGNSSNSTVAFSSEGKTYAAEVGISILELAEQNKQKIESGCRVGMCGADPVFIKEGWEQLSEITTDEQATLDRLGYSANVRMACCAKIEKQGAVVISMELEKSMAQDVQLDINFDVDEKVKKVVIIGNGVAGITAADHIRRTSQDVEIYIVGDEAHNFYNRMGIARLIYGRSAMKGLYLIDENWYEDKKLQAHLNTKIKKINVIDKIVELGVGEPLAYDKLILAMGSEARRPSFEGNRLPGIFVLRKAEDALNLRSYVQNNDCKKAVISGGGLLGLEAAYAIKEMGLQVTVLERGEWLMRRQLDRRAGEFLRILLAKMGIDIMTHAEVASCIGNDGLEQVQLKDGCRLSSKILLLAAGIIPNIQLAKDAGLECAQGVRINNNLQTSDENIYAVGDVSEHEGKVFGLWTTAADQAKLAATNVLGDTQSFQSATPSTMLKVVGVDVFSSGEFEAEDGAKEYYFEDMKRRKYCKVVLRDNCVVGAILIGKISFAESIKKAVAKRTNLSSIIDKLENHQLSAIDDVQQ